MKRLRYNTDDCGNAKSQQDEDAYSRWQEDLSEREREEKAEEEIMNELKNNKDE